MALLILLEGRLQARPDPALPDHVNANHGDVLVALVEVRRHPHAKHVGLVEDHAHMTILAVDEPDVGVTVRSPDGGEDLGVEGEVGLHVEGPDLELLDLVGGDLRHVDGVVVRGYEA